MTQIIHLENSIDIKNSLYSLLLKEYPKLYDKDINSKKNTVLENKKYKYVATDGYVITHKYDEKNEKLVLLERNEFLEVSPKQRIINQLNLLYSAKIYTKVNGKNIGITNPFRIDKKNIAAYQKNKTKIEYKSFKIINDSKKNPILILTTAGIPEKDISGVYDAVKRAIALLEEKDPEMLTILIKDHCLRVLSGNVILEKMRDHRSVAITELGNISFSTNNIGNDPLYYLFSIVNLSRLIGNNRYADIKSNDTHTYYMSKKLDNDPTIDRRLWTQRWLDLHRYDIFIDNYQDYIELVKKIK